MNGSRLSCYDYIGDTIRRKSGRTQLYLYEDVLSGAYVCASWCPGVVARPCFRLNVPHAAPDLRDRRPVGRHWHLFWQPLLPRQDAAAVARCRRRGWLPGERASVQCELCSISSHPAWHPHAVPPVPSAPAPLPSPPSTRTPAAPRRLNKSTSRRASRACGAV